MHSPAVVKAPEEELLASSQLVGACAFSEGAHTESGGAWGRAL